MFSKNPIFNFVRQGHWIGSIRGRLTWLYGLSVFSLLVISSMLLYFALIKSIAKENSQFLMSEINMVRSSLQQKGDTILLKQAKESLLQNNRYFYRIIDNHGHIIIETPGMSQLLPAPNFDLLSLRPSDNSKLLRKITIDNKPYLSMTMRVNLEKDSNKYCIIQAALDVRREEGIIADYRRNLLLILLLGGIGSAGIGVLTAQRGMRPLNEIVKTIEDIHIDQLQQRLSPAKWPQELHSMVFALNKLLSRIEENFNKLTQYSSDLAHELRTPINNLLGETELALTKRRTQEEYQNVLVSNLEEYQRLSKMINNLLFIARSENPQQQIKREWLELPRALEKLCEFHKILAEDRGVNLICEGIAKLYAEPILFHQAVSNIVVNAISHTPASGSVRIVAKQITDIKTEITVEDTGVGIAEEHLSRLFDRFYRVDSARSKELGGTGLGLSIVKSIMNLHSGHVHIKSQIGKGTVVTLIFESP